MESISNRTDAPDWWRRALSTPGRDRVAEVSGCAIHYLEWGDAAKPGLLLVPASAGHAHWFDHVAPLFADQFHVAAIDLSGCGDSGRRGVYTHELIIEEIFGVCAASGMLDAPVPPTIVGHSAGAQFAMRTAIAHDDRLLGVITVDGLRYARLAKDHAVKVLEGERPAPRPARVYADLEEAIARFRLMPQPLAPIDAPHILEHIARHSFRPSGDGWTSKYDPAQGSTISLALELTDALKELRCSSAAIFCEHTHLADDTAVEAITAASEGRTVVFSIRGASHYPMIDSPFAFVAAVKGVTLSWIAAAGDRSRDGWPAQRG
jgi:pimeloyl-ACP methyl ester carboxylesterase